MLSVCWNKWETGKNITNEHGESKLIKFHMAPMIKTCNLPLTFFRFNDNDFLKLYLFHVYKMIFD